MEDRAVKFMNPTPSREEAERMAEMERQERMRRIMEKETKA